MRWAFFVDANLEPRVADLLEDEGYRAEYSDYVLAEDADDEDEDDRDARHEPTRAMRTLLTVRSDC
jgi:predicted nuclease of predicted toxin-antitoxin system